jgi:TonB family protein
MSSIKRPTAAEWQEHLTEVLENQGLSRCERFPKDFKHIKFAGKPCPQCQLEAMQSVRELNKKYSTASSGYLQGGGHSKYQTTNQAPPKLPSTKSEFGGLKILLIAVLVIVAFVFISNMFGEESVPSRPTAANKKSTSTSVVYDAAYLNNPAPSYPVQAFRDKAEGTVLVRVQVLPNGQSGQVELHTSSSFESLDAAAISTVKKWRFKPATVDGQPITQWVTIPITFRLTKPESVASTATAEPSVATIQQYLRRLGFDPGPVDGILGTKTRRAIQDFQISQGLAGEGLITPNLEGELRARLSALQKKSLQGSSGNRVTYVSVYVSSRGGAGWSAGAGSQLEADSAALANCRKYGDSNQTCKKWFGDAANCVAFARDSQGVSGGAWGPTDGGVRDNALKNCRENGGRDCKVAGSLCS